MLILRLTGMHRNSRILFCNFRGRYSSACSLLIIYNSTVELKRHLLPLLEGPHP